MNINNDLLLEIFNSERSRLADLRLDFGETDLVAKDIFGRTIYAPTIYSYRSCCVIVLRRWLAKYKKDAMFEIKAIKNTPDPETVSKIAEEIVGFLQKTFSSFPCFIITFPPRGASKGPQYLAEEITKKVSCGLSIPYQKFFLDRIRSGNSHHPLNFLNRKPLSWLEIPTQYDHILLIDDIVTSGNTLEECIHLLNKDFSRCVIPVAWIGGDVIT